jgi:hypothetical protein
MLAHNTNINGINRMLLTPDTNTIKNQRVNAFRNKLKMTNAGLSIISVNDGVSQGSRHIIKLNGINREDDMLSIQAQEELYQNEFERDYTRLEKLGEGCSAEVVKCEHKKLNQLMAAKIIRSKDEEYI